MEAPAMTVPVTELSQAPRAVVDKAFTVLEAWRHRGETLGSSELARRTGLPKSTTHRLLGMLEAADVVERLGNGYRLGTRLHRFSRVFAARYPHELRDVSLPFLQDLYELTHETVHLAVLDGTDVHCVEKVYGHRRSPVRSRVDRVLPAHSTALGKALLAYSDATTQRRVLTSTAPEPVRLPAEPPATVRCGAAHDRPGAP